MTSIHLQTSFDPPRPMSQQGLHSSPAVSPKPPGRSASQASLHLAPVSTGNFSPALPPDSAGMQNGSLTSFPGQFRPFTPAAMTLPMPHTASYAPPPPSAPPVSFYPNNPSAGFWDGGRHGAGGAGGHAMMRTISHAHPMNSATEHTASTRYSPSPHSAGGLMNESPPSASVNHSGYHMSHLQQPTVNVQDDGQMKGHINPSLFNNQNNNYPMSRSTSGASVSDNGNEMGRLLTPHYEYRDGGHDDMRKVSDPMNFGRDRLYPASYAPSYQAHSGHGLGLGPHPQPTELYFRGNPYGDHYAMSSERSDVKPNVSMMNAETDYERERQVRIMENERLFQDVGLSGLNMRQRNDSGAGHRNRKPTLSKKRSYGGPVRASGRIASVGRASYADLDGNDDRSASSDEYSDGGDEYDEDEFRPTKKPRGRTTYAQRTYNTAKPRRSVELSLWGLLQVYPEIPHLFPLFYYTLNNDLTINSDSVPLIGSIPSTCTPQEKAEGLRRYFHRGRRVLAQLDAFSSRCDRKYDGPDEKWPEMDYHTRIAVRDVRRKVVERCENYKYTRRDILDKAVGKNKWQPIEAGMIEWQPDGGSNDPAGDLANVTLTLPTPPASAYPQQHQQPRIISNGGGMYPNPNQGGRNIRPFPRRNVSQAPHSARIMSVNMDGSNGPGPVSAAGGYSQLPPSTTASGVSYFTPAPQTAPPMYGEDEVPMSVQLPSTSGVHTPHQPIMSAAATSPMPLQNGLAIPPMSASMPLPSATQGWASTPIAAPAAHTPVHAPIETAEVNGNDNATPEAVTKHESDEEEGVDGEAEADGDEDNSKEFDNSDLVA